MNNMYNPFQMQKFFGQNIITSKLTPGGKKEVIGNVLYSLIYFICFIYSIYSNNNRIGVLRYNFISQMRFCMNYYFASYLMLQMSFLMTFLRKRYINCYQELINYTNALIKINIYKDLTLKFIIIKYIVVYTTVIPMIVWDIYVFQSEYNFAFFICFYLPGLAIGTYLIGISALMEICTTKYISINNYLETLSHCDDTVLQKYNIYKGNDSPKLLLNYFPGETYTIYQKLFLLIDEITETTRLINEISGYDLLAFMIMVTINMLSFVYDICIDASLYMNGNSLPPRSIYATEYWSLMSFIGMMSLISTSSKLMDNADNTKKYLHYLGNLYPKLNEHLEIFSLQLIHGKLNISAANFFTIHRGILYNLISAWLTYIILFMQLNTDIASVDEE